MQKYASVFETGVQDFVNDLTRSEGPVCSLHNSLNRVVCHWNRGRGVCSLEYTGCSLYSQ